MYRCELQWQQKRKSSVKNGLKGKMSFSYINNLKGLLEHLYVSYDSIEILSTINQARICSGLVFTSTQCVFITFNLIFQRIEQFYLITLV